jgi:hypothetical protein
MARSSLTYIPGLFVKFFFEEISIFSNSSHFERRAGLSDPKLKRDRPMTFPEKFALILFSGFRGETTGQCQNSSSTWTFLRNWKI